MTTATQTKPNLAEVPRHLREQELDRLAQRLEEIGDEEETIRAALREQIENFGNPVPRSEKSRRILGQLYRFTLSEGSTMEIRDTEVEKINAACPPELFEKLFVTVRRYKLTGGAFMLLAGALPADAPRNLRQMFQAAVLLQTRKPTLKIERIKTQEDEEE